LRAGRRASFLCVGNWTPRKGILDVLDALARLPADTATLHLVGNDAADRRYAARVRARLRDPALVDRVVVHGPRPAREVATMYDAADVFVLPSTKEPYGTVLGEALAAGLPVVGWDAGNLPHLVAHGREGLVLPVGDVDGLAGALRRLAEDDHYRGELAAAARQRGDALPTWKDTAREFFTALREAAA
jgi:glycosyltransferase involved in cell wall biosynthesis